MDYQQLTPELELLGEAIGQVWKKSDEGTSRAVLDTLTGIHNRRGLYIAMKPLAYLARRERQRAGVLILEISNLKEINTTFGHKTGDEVLVATSKAIASRLRKSDVLGRFGGDDFLALLTRFDEKSFERIGSDLIRLVGKVSARNARPALIVGGAWAMVGDDVKGQLEALIRGADAALEIARKEEQPLVVRVL
jgi:diguanylate cyclase (GGDEF)-like protein